MKTNIAHVVTSLPRPVVGVAWQNRYEATTASILVLLTAAAVLPNVRGKTGEHALQLQMPLANVLHLLPTAATAPATTTKPAPLAPLTAELAVAVVARQIHLPLTLVVETKGVMLSPIVEPTVGTLQMVLVQLVKFAVKKKGRGPMATVVMTKTGDRLAGVPAGMPLAMVGLMATATMPTPMVLTRLYAASVVLVKLTVPQLVPFAARQMAVAGLVPTLTPVLRPFPLSLRPAPPIKLFAPLQIAASPSAGTASPRQSSTIFKFTPAMIPLPRLQGERLLQTLM